MDTTVGKLLIAVGTVLIVVAAAAAIGLVLAKHLDGKNARNQSGNKPPNDEFHR